WKASDWTASDDRVRGGKSESYFETDGSSGRFFGDLDIDTLGGAGFASQRTTDDTRTWNLSNFDGIRVNVDKADAGKKYTLILKDSLLPKNADNGREQATTSYEYDFTTPSPSTIDHSSSTTILIPWSKFKATYRGREQDDAKPLETSSIKRISIMMRSFFGTQKGPFSITIRTISAYSDKGQSSIVPSGSADEKGGLIPSRPMGSSPGVRL
ncbi:NADH:ubiquinone oxidoreductase intermediate-associated protein 30, partial [Elsinoe ampelina]